MALPALGFPLLILLVGGLSASEVPPDDLRSGAIVAPIAMLDGNLWEQGGWDPPFSIGDELQLVGVVVGVNDWLAIPLPWQPEPVGACGGCNQWSGTQQSKLGAVTGVFVNYIAAALVDTRNGNSGGAMIESPRGFAAGIHTHSDCSTGIGTAFTHPELHAAIQDWFGPTEYVDELHPWVGSPNGDFDRPWRALPEAVANVPSGGIVAVVPGDYSAAKGNTFTAGAGGVAMTLKAPVGGVTIGN